MIQKTENKDSKYLGKKCVISIQLYYKFCSFNALKSIKKFEQIIEKVFIKKVHELHHSIHVLTLSQLI
jgi:hypothetical protein